LRAGGATPRRQRRLCVRMHHRRSPALVVAFSFAACSSTPVRPGEIEDDDYRFGPLIAPAQVDIHLERSPSDPQPRIGDANDIAWTGTIENRNRLLLLRGDWVHAESRFDSGPGRAETDVGTVTFFTGPRRFGCDALRITPLIGFGLGFARFVPVDVAMDGDSGPIGVFALGVDIELLHHVQIQLVASHGEFGEPGDTEGEVNTLSIGGGLRF
jgi:hypothetical protein